MAEMLAQEHRPLALMEYNAQLSSICLKEKLVRSEAQSGS